MPGVVAEVRAAVGKAVTRGDVLLTLEAMKMQTSVHAEIDGTVAEVLAQRGAQVDAKDLLVVLQ
jgi:pyruvate carboxylase